MGPLALLFILTPILELWLLVRLGGVIGAGWTILVVLGTGFAGAWLARREGLKTLQEWMALSAQGVLPGEQIFSGVAIFLGGALLLTPGLLTDVVGFALLMPPSRAFIQLWVMQRLKARINMQQVHVNPANSHVSASAEGASAFGGGYGPGQDGQIIDQTFEESSSPPEPGGTGASKP